MRLDEIRSNDQLNPALDTGPRSFPADSRGDTMQGLPGL